MSKHRYKYKLTGEIEEGIFSNFYMWCSSNNTGNKNIFLGIKELESYNLGISTVYFTLPKTINSYIAHDKSTIVTYSIPNGVVEIISVVSHDS